MVGEECVSATVGRERGERDLDLTVTRANKQKSLHGLTCGTIDHALAFESPFWYYNCCC